MLASVSVVAFFFPFRGMRTPLVLANSASLVLKGVAEEQIVNLISYMAARFKFNVEFRV